MKIGDSILLTIFVFILFPNPSHIVHSQNTDACKDDINFNDIVTFDTTALSCQPVWQNQGFLLRYALAGKDTWSFLLSAPNSNTWLGIGFSKDGKMVGSSAVVGWVYQNGTGLAKQYFLKEEDRDQVLVDQGVLKLVDNTTTAFMQSNVIYLAFQLNTVQPLTEVIYAVGPYGILPDARDGLKLSFHRDQTGTKLDYATGSSSTQKSPFIGLRRTHGALNMVGWGILIPMGVIVARYFKHWDPFWYYTHIAFQFFGWLLGLAGFMLGIVTQGFTNAKVDNHKRLGITILTIGCLQVSALLVKPEKESKYRKYWNWYHHYAGRILILLAISNIFYGINLGMEGASWYGTYGAILAIFVIVAVVLEIRACMKT